MASRPDAEFGSLDEINEQLAEWVTVRNSRPLDDFMGLSPQQMAQL